MKSKARSQGMEVSEQREEKRNKGKSPAAGRFYNWLIYRYLKNVVWDLVEDPQQRQEKSCKISLCLIPLPV